MAIDVGLIFTALGVAKSVAEFAGILDSIEAKVDRLIQSELNAGLRVLEQVAHATVEQVSLLREARGCFNKAVSLEMGYCQVVALLGLSLCHHWLGEKQNCTKALEEILAINPVTTLKLAIAVGKEVGKGYVVLDRKYIKTFLSICCEEFSKRKFAKSPKILPQTASIDADQRFWSKVSFLESSLTS